MYSHPPAEKDVLMSYLRFTPQEYQVLERVRCRLDLGRSLNSFRRSLVLKLERCRPELAQKISRLHIHQLKILLDHFRQDAKPEGEHDLNAAEVKALTHAFGPLLFHARFSGPLKRALARHLADTSPELAAKLHRLSQRQFEALCEHVKQFIREDA
jgi:hypothetical protein